MSLKERTPDFFRTIAFRMSAWYTGIFFICTCIMFLIFYLIAEKTLSNQVDQYLIEQASQFSRIIRHRGVAGGRRMAIMEAQAAGEKTIFYRLLYPTGEVFASSRMGYWENVDVNTERINELLSNHAPVFQSIGVSYKKSSKTTRQKARILYIFVAKDVILQTGIVTEFNTRFLKGIIIFFIISITFTLLLCAVSGWYLVKKALSGAEIIRKTAQSVTGENLAQRVSVLSNNDELTALAETFNEMLDRIERLIISIRQITDDIAHDLKIPLTRIRGIAELCLTQKGSISDYEEMAANTIEESDRLLDMINTMLMISRADAGEGQFEFVSVDISSLVNDACELFVPLAEDVKLNFTWNVPPGILIQADRKFFQRAFSNLLDNAMKYTPEGGRVQVDVHSDDQNIYIKVSDTGPGIDLQYSETIFERFFRIDSSRSTQGSGLGLSLARSIIRQHGGDILLESSKGQGALFIIRLPYCNLPVI